MNDSSWNYHDADQHDPLSALGIPVTGSHPEYYYLSSFDRDSECRPTDDEAIMLSSWIGYQRSLYKSYFVQEWFRDRPLDVVPGGHNTVVFHKWSRDNWGYRRTTYTSGPIFWPGSPNINQPGGHRSLIEVLDYIKTVCGEVTEDWITWKIEHPEIFQT